MSSIRLKIDEVRTINGNFRRNSLKVSDIKSRFSSLRYNIDNRIQSRRDIASRIYEACNSINALETRFQDLDMFVNKAMSSYGDTEAGLVSKAMSVGVIGNGSMGYESDIPLIPGNPMFPGESILLEDNDDLEEQINAAKREQYIADAIVALTAQANLNSDKFLIADKNLKFQMFYKDGKAYIKVIDGKITKLEEFEKYRNLLKEKLGGTAKWDRDFVSRLVNGGVPLYDDSSSKYIKSNSNKLLNTKFEDLNKYVKSLEETRGAVFKGTWKNSFFENAKFWESFTGIKGASTLTKVGKVGGMLGIMVTAADDFAGDINIHDQNGWHLPTGEGLKNFGIDLGIDIGAGSAAMATGAAMGSLILPPVGTVVGVAAGAAINFGINYKFGGPPPESIVDHTKNFVKHPIESLEKTEKWLNKVFW